MPCRVFVGFTFCPHESAPGHPFCPYHIHNYAKLLTDFARYKKYLANCHAREEREEKEDLLRLGQAYTWLYKMYENLALQYAYNPPKTLALDREIKHIRARLLALERETSTLCMEETLIGEIQIYVDWPMLRARREEMEREFHRFCRHYNKAVRRSG